MRSECAPHKGRQCIRGCRGEEKQDSQGELCTANGITEDVGTDAQCGQTQCFEPLRGFVEHFLVRRVRGQELGERGHDKDEAESVGQDRGWDG